MNDTLVWAFAGAMLIGGSVIGASVMERLSETRDIQIADTTLTVDYKAFAESCQKVTAILPSQSDELNEALAAGTCGQAMAHYNIK